MVPCVGEIWDVGGLPHASPSPWSARHAHCGESLVPPHMRAHARRRAVVRDLGGGGGPLSQVRKYRLLRVRSLLERVRLWLARERSGLLERAGLFLHVC